jgi:hypothetical protein
MASYQPSRPRYVSGYSNDRGNDILCLAGGSYLLWREGFGSERMIRLIKRFVDWLDARFPAKVVITERDLTEMRFALNTYKTEFENYRESAKEWEYRTVGRIDKLVDSVNSIKDLLAKGGATVKPEADKLREAFIRGEFDGAIK